MSELPTVPLPWYLRRREEWTEEDYKQALISKVYNLLCSKYQMDPVRAQHIIETADARSVFDRINKQKAIELVDQLSESISAGGK